MTPFYIFDIDGVLADNSHRQHLIKPQHEEMTQEEWTAWSAECHKDVPISPMLTLIEAIRTLQSECPINCHLEFWTARGPEAKAMTVLWLEHQLCWTSKMVEDCLRIRHTDLRQGYLPAVDLKRNWLNIEKLRRGPGVQFIVFEDTPELVEMFLEEGCIVNHVRVPGL